MIGFGDKFIPLTPRNKVKKRLDFDDVMKRMIKNSSNEPFPYYANSLLRIFMLLYILKINKNDCHFQTENMYDRDLFISRQGNLEMSDTKYEMIKTAYKKCTQNKKMLVISLIIKDKGDNISHANMLIFNNETNEVERFEPHGANTLARNVNDSKIDMSINFKLITRMNKDLNINLKYLTPFQLCPVLYGFQIIESKATPKHKFNKFGNLMIRDSGYCFAWSLFYANLRLKFPKKSGREIIRDAIGIMGTDAKVFRKFIRGQISFLEKELNKLNTYINFQSYISLRMKTTLKKNEFTKLIEYERIIEQFVNEEFKKYS